MQTVQGEQYYIRTIQRSNSSNKDPVRNGDEYVNQDCQALESSEVNTPVSANVAKDPRLKSRSNAQAFRQINNQYCPMII